MKKIVLVLGVAALLFASCGSSPSSTSAQSNAASYYVRANGNDKNTGISEDVPFQTLARAVQAASKSSVKKVTVIGTLTGRSDIENSDSAEILITGKPGAAENEKAVLKADEQILMIHGKSNIRFEYITLRESSTRAIGVDSNATLTLGRDVVITQCKTDDYGAGIAVGGTLFMTENATIIGNTGGRGVGLIIIGGKATMRDEASVAGNFSSIRSEGDGGGGIIVADESTLTMQGNSSISGNKAVSGGGVCIYEGTLIMEGNSTIKNNEANVGSDSMLYGGGGIYIWDGLATLKDNSLVTGNKAVYGGGVFTKGDLEFSEGVIDRGGSYTFQKGNIRGNTAANGPDVYANYQ